MKIYNSAETNQYHYNSNFNNKIYRTPFKGRTEVYALTDVHQNANKYCRLVNEIIQRSNHKDNIILLDGGDMFKGIYPQESLLGVYATAKKLCPNIEIVYNVGNNDPGFRSTERQCFRDYLKILNQAGINVISANIIDETTGKIPEGIKPYTIINRDGDNILYVGFVIDKIKQSYQGMSSFNPISALEKLAPELKKQMKENNCKGMVMLIHDRENNTFKLKNKAIELGFSPEFIIGGHTHRSYVDDKEHIYYPEAFGLSMLHFTLDINKRKHNIGNFERIVSEDCNLGIYKQEVEAVELAEKYNEPIAKSVVELDYPYNTPKDKMLFTELGTFYADAIKNITNSEIGLIPKSLIYKTLPKKQDGYITKIDILKTFLQPSSNIMVIEVTPEELRDIYQRYISQISKIYESSQNVSIGLSSDNIVKQIKINGKELFKNDGSPLEPKRKIKVAIDYFSVWEKLQKVATKKESQFSMYDAIVKQLRQVAETFSGTERYPVAVQYAED